MLCELRARQLGVIEDLSLVFGPGMTALTGETGAGKTLVVEALELLLGGRAEPLLVRPGATEAVVEGRFVMGTGAGEGPGVAGPEGGENDREVVLSRVVPKQGRSRAYIGTTMATAGALAELAGSLVDLHGQHEQQSLLSMPAQRDALDAYAGAYAARHRRDKARERLKQVEEAMAAAGGSSSAREREVELLRYQLAELDAAKLTTPDEDDRLAEEQESLARAAGQRAAAALAHEALAGDDQLCDRLGRLVGQVAGHPRLAGLHSRLRSVLAELTDAAEEARCLTESLDDDPERLAQVTERRALLQELRRKYGQGGPRATPAAGRGRAGLAASLEEVFAWREAARARLEELEGLAGKVSQLAAEHELALGELSAASGELGRARREAAGRLARAVEVELRKLAMPGARFSVQVGPASSKPEGEGIEPAMVPDQERSFDGEPSPAGKQAEEDMRELSGEDVCFMLAANAGEPLLPLAKVASGGELARAMLALRLVLLAGGRRAGGSSGDVQVAAQGVRASPPGVASGPETLIFDEVDAGIGGEAALAVGEALAELATRYQVVVVTHLPQVAAFADNQVVVSKSERAGRAVATAEPVFGQKRVVELSRMLSGHPASKTARRHAEELLRRAARGPGEGAGTAPASGSLGWPPETA